VAVASAGPYANLQLTSDRQPHQHPTTQFFTGRMPFLPPNQQRQSTEGYIHIKYKYIMQSTEKSTYNIQCSLTLKNSPETVPQNITKFAKIK